MSIAAKNARDKKRRRRLYEDIIEAKVMKLAGQVLEARHEARVAKENEAKAFKAMDELVGRHLQVGILNQNGHSTVYSKWTSKRYSLPMPRQKYGNPWEMSADQIRDLGSFIRDVPGFQIGWRQVIDELTRNNCLNELHYLEMLAEQIGHSISRLVLEKMIQDAREQTTKEKPSAAIA